MFNQITNYQASFNVSDPDKVIMFRLKSILFNWIKGKETDKLLRHEDSYNQFCHRCSWSNLWHSRSSLATNTFISDNHRSWALQYSERNTHAHMYWYTDIGLTHDDGTLTVNIRIAYAWDSENLSYKRVEPRATIPRFVRAFFKEASKNDWKVYAQNESFRISERPFPLTKQGDGKALAEWINNSQRQFPLIVFNGRSLVDEACNLSRDLVGKANIIVIDDNHELAAEIKQHLSHELRVPFNNYRVFFRINHKNPRSERHRWFDPTDADYADQREALVSNLLRNHTVAGSSKGRAVEKIKDIGRLINLSQLRKAASEGASDPEQMRIFEELLNSAEDERDEHKKEAEYYATEHGVLEGEFNRMKSKLIMLESKQPAGQQRMRPLPALPSNIEECLDALEQQLSPKVVINANAKKTASEYPQCQSVNECWKMLIALHDTMHPLKFEEGRLDEGEFKDRTGIDYAKTEGKQTKSNGRLVAMRKFDYEGQQHEMWSHLKFGTKGDKVLRVHFAFDEKNKRIIVGHIGRHMENATTKSL